jgi:NAD+ kinase
MSSPRVIVCAKRTAYRRYIEDEQDPRAQKLLRKRDPSVARWLAAHRDHMRTLDTVLGALEKMGARAVLLERAHVAFDTADAALVVTVGGDGTLLAASHNVGGVPILGVNSAPASSVGFFCAAQRSTARSMIQRTLDGTLPRLVLARMAVAVNGRIRSKRVLNEALYSHCSPAATSRYILRFGRVHEEQRSSGFWIGPAAGSTAAQKSAGGKVLPLASRELQLVSREPYKRAGERYRLTRVVVPESTHLEAQSMMQDACMFFDGPYTRISVRLGDVVRFQVSEEPLTVCGLTARRRKAPAAADLD